MLLSNLGLGDRLLPSVLPGFQHDSPGAITLLVRRFNAGRKPKICVGLTGLSTVVDNIVCNLFHCFLKETSDLA